VHAALTPGWPLQRIDATLRAILRAGAFELTARTDVPGRVVVSEYVDIARAFFDADVAGMVNAVLDTLARKLRPAEFSVDTSDAGA
jgi:N utilization substance protein B